MRCTRLCMSGLAAALTSLDAHPHGTQTDIVCMAAFSEWLAFSDWVCGQALPGRAHHSYIRDVLCSSGSDRVLVAAVEPTALFVYCSISMAMHLQLGASAAPVKGFCGRGRDIHHSAWVKQWLCCCCSAQTEICQSLFLELHAAGNIAEQTMEQLYSEAAGKFLADRFVVGTCPKCKYEVRGVHVCVAVAVTCTTCVVA
jgi:hypothetical protein